ncbi:MAG TPA: hypothetical protein VGN44_11185 [Candidatus Angelobacter sp.]|jgi:hypothetical protein
MDTAAILAELTAERDRLNTAIAVLRGRTNRNSKSSSGTPA